MSTTLPLIRIEQMTKRFGAVLALDDVSLEIEWGDFFALLGPSGCGKTTLMRLIAGFEQPDSGRIFIDGVDMSGVPPHLRPVNMMFQSYALFPHMNVEKNIGFGLQQQRVAAAEIAARVATMLALVQLEGFGARMPHQLSGGQKQRVALARALIKRPKLLLLDEPLAALDRKLREETQFELTRLQAETGTAFLMVTHDQEEAMAMARRIGVMQAGRIAQIGSPQAIYDQPASAYVAKFVGDINLLEGQVESQSQELHVVKSVVGPLQVRSETRFEPGARVHVAVRPERLVMQSEACAAPNCVAGKIQDMAFLGGVTRYRVALASGFVLYVSQANAGAETLATGAQVHVSFPADAARLIGA